MSCTKIHPSLVIMNEWISYRHQNHFLSQALNMFISAVMLGILTWGSMRTEPASLKWPLEGLRFLALSLEVVTWSVHSTLPVQHQYTADKVGDYLASMLKQKAAKDPVTLVGGDQNGAKRRASHGAAPKWQKNWLMLLTYLLWGIQDAVIWRNFLNRLKNKSKTSQILHVI